MESSVYETEQTERPSRYIICTPLNFQGKIMKINKLVTSFFVVCALLTGVAGCSSTEKSKESSSSGAYVDESTITAKIKSKFAADPDLSALDIKVDTDKNGVVVLTGTANTQAEADKAHAVAHSVEGVKKVINHIKVKKNY
jgi:hyperosmotically inducible protein